MSCDKCKCDWDYKLPELDIRYHEVAVDHLSAVPDKFGQGQLYRTADGGVSAASREKRDTMDDRIVKMKEIVEEAPEDHFILWHDLEDERRAIEKAIPAAVSVYGSQDLDKREKFVIDFRNGKIQYLAGKPQMLGSGPNFQYHCHRAIFAGVGYKFKDFIQAIHRLWRFLQKYKVRIDIIYAESEKHILDILLEKWKRHDEQAEIMSGIIKKYGLSHEAMATELKRGFGVERTEVKGESFTVVNNDSVDELARMEENSVGLVVTSIPFSTQYEYSPNYCFDQETEALTRRGWLNFGEVTLEDYLGTVNPNTLAFEWQQPSRLVWESYQGELLHFQNRSFDQLVTPNHSLFAARRGQGFTPKAFHRVEAKVIAQEYESAHRKSDTSVGRLLRGWRTCLIPPCLGTGEIPELIDIPSLPSHIRSGHGVELYWIPTQDFMRLVGWYLSEGHCDSFDSRSGGRISIAQVNSESLRAEIADLFVRIGLPPSLHSRQISVWCRNLAWFLVQEFGHGSKQKHIPRWVKDLHPGLLTILRDTMMKGDGSKDGSCYRSYSPQLCDDFQEICLKTGWRANIKGNRIQLGNKQIYPEIRSTPTRIEYDGMIGCATVPNGLLVVRRNGKPCISGNCDFGHTDNNEHFFEQMDYLTPNLLRVLQPGRIAAIHVKDRIVPGGLTGLGFQTVYPFHARCIDHYTKHGFAYIGMKTIVTDVVRENNQTYRLGWSEQCKDGTKMGVGMPEYLLLFRKPPTDNSNAYADLSVVKDKDCYSRSRWQIDAHGFTRSSGDRLLTPNDLWNVPHSTIWKLFKKFSLDHIYDFEGHVALSESLETCTTCRHIHTGKQGKCKTCDCSGQGRLPTTFMLLQPQSWHPNVWSDITRMLTLNSNQCVKGKQMHLCPLQFDLVDRAIAQWSNPGELILDPFGGLGTVAYRAILKGRRGYSIELSPEYFEDSIFYCKQAEAKASMPTLFDLAEVEEEGESEEVPA